MFLSVPESSKGNLGGLSKPRKLVESQFKFSLWPLEKLTCEIANDTRSKFQPRYQSSQIQPQLSRHLKTEKCFCLSLSPQDATSEVCHSFYVLWQLVLRSVEPPQNRLSEKMVHRHFQTARLCATEFSNFFGKDVFQGQHRFYIMAYYKI